MDNLYREMSERIRQQSERLREQSERILENMDRIQELQEAHLQQTRRLRSRSSVLSICQVRFIGEDPVPVWVTIHTN